MAAMSLYIWFPGTTREALTSRELADRSQRMTSRRAGSVQWRHLR